MWKDKIKKNQLKNKKKYELTCQTRNPGDETKIKRLNIEG